MKSLYDIPAPAKLNLFLHITGRRPDGYHLLQSAFMLIDWCDLLHFELRHDGRTSREDLSQPLPAEDLILRAARALQARTGSPLGVHIGVDKRIPAQAGMGGGSSDAATCLLAAKKDLRRAADLAKQATNLAPDRVDLHLLLAKIYEEVGMSKSALGEIERAAKLSPRDASIKGWLKRLKRRDG